MGEITGFDVEIDELGHFVMGGYALEASPFFVEDDPGSSSLGEIVFDSHVDDRPNSGKGVGHDSDQCPVTHADDGVGGYGIHQGAGILFVEHRGLPGLGD